MGFRFRRSVKILPGIRLNYGKKGFTSTTFGGKFFKTNVSDRGVKHSINLPIRGLSYQTKTYRNAPAKVGPAKVGPADPNIQLYWYCSSCYVANLPDSKLCCKCGGNYSPNLQQPGLDTPGLDTTDVIQLLILIGGVLGLTLIAIVGVIMLVRFSH